jgi:hypothetical protein
MTRVSSFVRIVEELTYTYRQKQTGTPQRIRFWSLDFPLYIYYLDGIELYMHEWAEEQSRPWLQGTWGSSAYWSVDRYMCRGKCCQQVSRAQIFKLLRCSRIDSMEPIPPCCVAWRAGTTNLFLLGSWSPQIVSKFQHRPALRTF